MMRKGFFLLLLLSALQSSAQKTGRLLVDSLLNELPREKDDTVKARLYNRIFNGLLSVNINEAMQYARSGLTHTQKMKWPKGIAVFQNNLGMAYSDGGNYDSCIFYFTAALNTYSNDKYNMAVTLNNMGTAAQNIKADYTTAANYYFKALKLAEEMNDSILMPVSLTNVGRIYVLQKNYKKALEFDTRAIRILEKTGHQDELANSLESIGKTYYLMNELSKANSYFQQALTIYESSGNIKGLAAVWSSLALVYGKDYRKIAEARIKSKELWNEVNPMSTEAITNTGNLGLNYLDIARYDSNHVVKYGDVIPDNKSLLLKKAEENLNAAIQLSSQTGDLDSKTYFTGVLSELQEFKGDYKNAYYNLKLFKETEDSIYSQENKNKIAEAESQREIDKKNSELKINQLALSNQQKTTWGLAGGLILFSIIGFLLYRQVQIKKKNNTLLLQLNSELDEANKIKAKFFGILSHDLRNPIARFVTLLDLQTDDPGLFNAQQTAAHQKEISQAAGALLVTMEEMLLWSKGQMENFKPQIKTVPVNDLFGYIENSFISVKGVSFDFINTQNLTLNTDENYLQVIMYNLTSNAVKAVSHKPGAKIEWKAFEENGKTILSIRDNGDGINDEYISLLKKTATTPNAKTGFGLHLIRDLANAIDCSIHVHSSQSEGTVFQLFF